MYSPKYYREVRDSLITKLITEVGFATVLTEGDTEMISHLPVQLVHDQHGAAQLLTHCARANPHWRNLQAAGRAKFIFNGPHAYISPSWYAPKADNVPTWNYAVVHVEGSIEIIEDKTQVGQLMSDFVSHFETMYKTNWVLPVDEAAIRDLMKAIVVFKLKDLEFEGKFKLSQKQDPKVRETVIQNLETQASTSELAKYMKDVVL